MLLLLRRWLPQRRIIVVTDSSFATLELLAALLAAVGSSVTMITRLRLDAALYKPAPLRTSSQPGRPRLKGTALAKLCDQLNDRSQRWRRVVIRRWYS